MTFFRSRPPAVGLFLVVALAGSVNQRAFAAPMEPKHYFMPDAPGAKVDPLPNPLITRAGQTVRSAADWQALRRPEVLELFREHVYGRVPTTPYGQSFKVVHEDPHAMNGTATLRQIAITLTADEKSLTIPLTLFIPNHVTQPAPTFLFICNRSPDDIDPTRQKKLPDWPAEEGIARGYAMAAFFNGDVAPDRNGAFHEGVHGLLNHGELTPDSWGTLTAWAWGASRCLDYLVTDPGIAAQQVAVIGHSRGGKAALWAAAEDQRFALTCSNESGCGGAALHRHRVEKKETIAAINRVFPYWFNGNFKNYNDREDALPVDQHALLALLAPRAVAIGSAAEDLWADPRGEFLSAVHVRPVYQLFGKSALGAASEMPAINEPLSGDGLQYHIRPGKHDLTPSDWRHYWDFADRVFSRAAPPPPKPSGA